MPDSLLDWYFEAKNKKTTSRDERNTSIQNSITNQDDNHELFDIELKISLDSFFRKLKFNLEQKMIFEKKVNLLVKEKGKEIKFILKKFLKAF